jgi:hypothetical protein
MSASTSSSSSSSSSSTVSEPTFLVPQMIKEIARITKCACAKLLERDEGNPIGELLHATMKTQNEKAIIGIALRKRQMRRQSRAEEKETMIRFSDTVAMIYKNGYFLKGSDAFDGGGALPLSEESAKKLAMKFFEILHETDEPINILLVRNKKASFISHDLLISIICIR